MIQYTFTKHLNRTELGKGSTHEGYFFINKDVRDVFDELMPADKVVSFQNIDGGPSLVTRLTKGREYRLPGLGEFFSSIGLATEDEIQLLFRKNAQNEIEYFYKIVKHDNAVCLEWKDGFKGFDLLTAGRENLLNNATFNGESVELRLERYESKRSDSPSSTPIYSLRLGGNLFNGKGRECVFIEIKDDGIARISQYEKWTMKQLEI